MTYYTSGVRIYLMTFALLHFSSILYLSLSTSFYNIMIIVWKLTFLYAHLLLWYCHLGVFFYVISYTSSSWYCYFGVIVLTSSFTQFFPRFNLSVVISVFFFTQSLIYLCLGFVVSISSFTQSPTCFYFGIIALVSYSTQSPIYFCFCVFVLLFSSMVISYTSFFGFFVVSSCGVFL